MNTTRLLPLLLCAGSLLAQDAARPAFEVASVKPAAPGNAGRFDAKAILERVQTTMRAGQGAGVVPMVDKSRVSLRGWTLANLIAAAYRLTPDQVSGPPWMTEERFDVDAKLPDDAPSTAVNEMMQRLLEDRFSLGFHRENKEAQGYALVVAKGGAKLARAADKTADTPVDEDARKKKLQQDALSGLEKMRAEGGGMGGSSSRWRNSACTMAQVAAHFSGTLRTAVVNATGLDGEYAVDVAIQQAPDEDAASAASRALASLGLRLEPRKMMREMLAVDNASKTPKEN